MTAIHPEFAPVAILSCLSLLLPLPWHWRARNVATLSLIFWLFISNFIYAVDALVWAGNVVIKFRVWCDISEFILFPPNATRLTSFSDKVNHRRQFCPSCSMPLYQYALRTGRVASECADYACRPATPPSAGGHPLFRASSLLHGASYVRHIWSGA
jgi:Pheromone A receptor